MGFPDKSVSLTDYRDAHVYRDCQAPRHLWGKGSTDLSEGQRCALALTVNRKGSGAHNVRDKEAFSLNVRLSMARYRFEEIRTARRYLNQKCRSLGLSELDIRDISKQSLRTISKDLRLAAVDRIEPSFKLKAYHLKTGAVSMHLSGVQRMTFKNSKVKLGRTYRRFYHWVKYLLITNRRLTTGQILTLLESDSYPP